MIEANKAVAAIVEDIQDRRGLQEAWEAVDVELQKEIWQRWAECIEKVRTTNNAALENAAVALDAKADFNEDHAIGYNCRGDYPAAASAAQNAKIFREAAALVRDMKKDET